MQPNNDVMTSYDYYYRQAGLTPPRELTTAYISTVDAYLGDRKSSGYEFELFANPTRNWTLRAGYAYTDRTTTNVYNEGVPWWAARRDLEGTRPSLRHPHRPPLDQHADPL